MFKKTLFSVAALAVALTGSALAADLPSRKGPPPYIPPPPLMTWTGFYVGLNAGGTWSESNWVRTSAGILTQSTDLVYAPGMALGATANVPVGNSGGFIGGGQIGYNWQFANTFVAGIEADIQGIASSGNSAGVVSSLVAVGGAPANANNPVFTSVASSRKLDYLGTVRGRLGYLVTPALLVYGTGGLAYGGVNAATTITQAIIGPGGVGPSFAGGAFSDTRIGWTAGGGLEWMFWPHWSAKAEYLYYDLGSVTFSNGAQGINITPCACGGVGVASIVSQSTTRFNGHIVRAGVNYHFNWGVPPILAKY